MAISFVGAGGAGSTISNPSASRVLTCPAGVQNGDVMIALFCCQSSSASANTVVTPPSGWTQIGSTQAFAAAATQATAALFMKIASGETAGSTTYTLVWGAGNRSAESIAVFRGAVSTSVAAAQDATATMTNSGTGSSTTPAFPAITTVTTNAWRVGVGAGGVVATAVTAGSWTKPASPGTWVEDDDHGSSVPSGAVKQAISTIDHTGPLAAGVQAAASATASSAVCSVMWSIALKPAIFTATGTDTAGATDSLVSGALQPRPVSETIPTSDSVVSTVLHSQPTSDTATATDTVTRSITSGSISYSRTGTDTITLPADSPARVLTRVRGSEDYVYVNQITPAQNGDFEDGSTGWGLNAATGTATVTVDTTKKRTGTQSLRMAQTAPGNDNLVQNGLGGSLIVNRQYRATVWVYLNSFIDSTPGSLNFGLYLQGPVTGDTWTYQDASQIGRWVEHSIDYQTAYNVSNFYLCIRGDANWDSCTIRALEWADRTAAHPRSVADTLITSDTATGSVVHGSIPRTGTDTISIPADAVVRTQALGRGLIDTLPTVIDTATRGQLGAIRNPSEVSVHGTDSLARQINFFTVPSELLVTPFEVLVGSVNHFRNMAETPTQSVVDNFGRSGGMFNRNPSDLAGLADTQLIPSQQLWRTDNVEDIPTTEQLDSPTAHWRTNFNGDSAPAVDSPMAYGGNVRFAYEYVGGRVDSITSYRMSTGTTAYTHSITSTFVPRVTGALVWTRTPSDTARVNSDAATRPPFVRVRTAVDNIPLQPETNFKPVYHNFVLSGDEEILFRGDVVNPQYKLKRTGSDSVPIGTEVASSHQVKVGSSAYTSLINATFTQPRIAVQNRPNVEDVRSQFAETLFRTIGFQRAVREYAANSSAALGRSTLIQPMVSPVFSQILFLGINDTLTFLRTNGRLGVETLPVPDVTTTTRLMVGTRVVNDFVTGLNDNAVRNSLPRTRTGTDTAGATDSLVAIRVKARGVSDTAGAIDGYNTFATHPRPVSESLPSTFDANSSQRLLFRVPTDITVTSDVLARSLVNVRALSDAAVVTDLAKVNRVGRSATDTYPTSDSATVITAHMIVRTGTDLVIDGSDAAVSSAQAIRAPNDSASASDVLTRHDTLFRIFSETVAVVSDSATRAALGFQRTGFDISLVSGLDSVVRGTFQFRVFVDTASSSDVLVSGNAHFRSFTETVFQGESASAGARQFPRSPVDAANAFDLSATRTQNLTPRTGVDSTTTSDTLVRIFKPNRNPSESVPAVDSPTRQRFGFLTGTDTVTAADVLLRIRTPVRAGSDTTSTSEALARFVLFTRTAVDIVFGSDDSQRPGQVYFRAVGPDSAPASELAATTGRTFPRTPTDNVPIGADTAVRAAALKLRTAIESIPLVDTALRGLFITSRAVSDSVPIVTDTTGRQLGLFFRFASDTVPTVMDSWTSFHLAIKSVSETLSISEAPTRFVHEFRIASDTILTVFDGTANPQVVFRSVFDSISTSDISTRQNLPVRNPAEIIPSTETVGRMGHFTRFPLDIAAGLGTPDSATVGRSFGRAASDTVLLGAQVASRALTNARVVLDILTPVGDTSTVQAPHVRTMFDTAHAAESLSRFAVMFRYGIDAASAVDQIGVASQGVGRSVSEDVHFRFETTFSNTVANRFPIDVATASELVLRLAVVTRQVSEALSGLLDQADRSGRFSTFLVDNVAANDLASRVLVFARTASDAVTAIDQALATRVVGRRGSDSISASDVLVVRQLLQRISIDLATVSDFAFRLQNRVRYGLDTVHGTDLAAAVRSHFLLASDTVSSFDDVVRKTFKTRYGFDHLDSIFFPLDVDQTSRRLVSNRLPVDSAPVTDQARRIWSYLKATTDVATVSSDQANRQTGKIRYGIDRGSGVETGVRTLLAFRTVSNTLPGPADQLQVTNHRGRTTTETLVLGETLTDSRFRPDRPFGWPVPMITSVSRRKASYWVTAAVITFEFDRPVDAWAVRVNSDTAFDGVLAESWQGEPSWYGLATIQPQLLRRGENVVEVYGRSAVSGEWTRKTADDLVPA